MRAEWVKLADFGEYEHKKGIQILNETSANDIVSSFHSLHGRFIRKFIGLPVYIGHPDDDEFKSSNKSSNNRVYGRVTDIKVDDGALWVLIKWTSVGSVLFKNGILKHLSPRWVMEQLSNGKLSPNRMVSIGMTNHPNIRCDNIVKEEVIKDDVNPGMLPTLCDQQDENGGQCTKPQATLASPEKQADDEFHQSINDNCAITPCCDAGTPNSTGTCNTTCCLNEKSWNVRNNELAGLHTTSHTSMLTRSACNTPSGDKILELVFSRMHDFSERYTDAWAAVKRKNPSLFCKNF